MQCLVLILACARDLFCKLLIALLEVSSTLIAVNLCLPSGEARGLARQPGTWGTWAANSSSVTDCLLDLGQVSQPLVFFPLLRNGDLCRDPRDLPGLVWKEVLEMLRHKTGGHRSHF